MASRAKIFCFRIILGVAAVVALLIGELIASAARTRLYVMAIGNNALPVDMAARARLRPLNFADDDAASFFTLAAQLTPDAALLTELDRESQVRFPELVAIARQPSLSEIRRVLAQWKAAMLEGSQHDEAAQLLVFFSGHGSRARGAKPAALALLDGVLTAKLFADEIVAELPAQNIHLIIDACHAESIVEALLAKSDVVDAHNAERAGRSITRVSRVGIVVATHTGAQAHEWDLFQRGVFSHEIISGLRGAADVNQDGLVDYGELQAFLQAANRAVSDPQIRLQTIVRPPASNPSIAVVDLGLVREGAWLHGGFGKLGPSYIEDEFGNRLADVYAEFDASLQILVPVSRDLYIRGEAQVARVHLHTDERKPVESLSFTRPLAAKGAIETAWERGLFATAFGPLFVAKFREQQRLQAAPATSHP